MVLPFAAIIAPTAGDIPLRRLSDGFYATLDLGKGKRGLFLIDTGSHDNFVTPQGERLLRSTGAVLEPRGTLKSGPVTLSGRAVQPIRFVLWGRNQDTMDPISDGILGLTFFARYLVGLDLKHRTMRLWPHDLPSVTEPRKWLYARAEGGDKGYGLVPLHLSRGLLWGTAFLDGKPVEVVPDTGAGETFISAATARRLGWTTWTGGHDSRLYDGPVHVRHHTIHALRMGSVEYHGAHTVNVMDGARTIQFVGTDALIGAVMILDVRRATLVLAPVRGSS